MRTSAVGFALLQTLASITIALPVTIALAWALKSSGNSWRVAQQLNRIAALSVALESLANRVSSDMNSHRLPIVPRISSGSRLVDTDGNQIPFSVSRAANLPAENSCSLTYLRLAITHLRWVRDTNDNHSLTACRRTLEDAPPDQIHGWLAIGPDGFTELTATEGIDLTKKCLTIQSVMPLQSMIASQDLATLSTARLIVPIEQIYTAFVSRGGELRLLSFEGTQIIEHQPLYNGITGMTIALKEITPYQLSSLLFIGVWGVKQIQVQTYSSFPRLSLTEAIIGYSSIR